MSTRLRFTGGMIALASGAAALAVATPSDAAPAKRPSLHVVRATDQNSSTGCSRDGTQNVRQPTNYRTIVH
jgi:hypothetical protein